MEQDQDLAEDHQDHDSEVMVELQTTSEMVHRRQEIISFGTSTHPWRAIHTFSDSASKQWSRNKSAIQPINPSGLMSPWHHKNRPRHQRVNSDHNKKQNLATT